MEITHALEVLDALSHETRLEVFRLLVKAGPQGLPAGAIADTLGARQNTMSSHLKQLHQANLIVSERAGRSVIYRAQYATARELIVFLMEDCCAGDPAVCNPIAESLGRICN